MKFFKWTAITITGDTAAGIIWAENSIEISERLFAKQQSLLSHKPLIRYIRQPVLTSNEIIALLQHLSSLMTSGFHLNRALNNLAAATSQQTTRCYIESIVWQLHQGASLIETFENTPLFPQSISHVIAHAQASGILHEILPPIIEYELHKEKFRTKLFGMLFMPILSIILFIVLFLCVLIFVIPRLQSLSSTNDDSFIPFIGKISIYLQQHPLIPLYIFAILFITIIISMYASLYTHWGRKIKKIGIEKCIINSELLSAYHATQFFQLLALLHTAHNTLPTALKTCRQCMPLLCDTIKKIEIDVHNGMNFSSSFVKNTPFKKNITQKITPFIQVGEYTSDCAHTYNQCAQYLFLLTQTKSKALLRYLQPALIIFLGVCTTILIASLYLPILSLGEHINV